MTLDAVLNAYIDANLLLICATVIWLVARIVLWGSPLRRSYGAQLRLLYAALVLVAVVPLSMAVLDPINQVGLHANLRFGDIAVAQYLEGHIAMAPSQFETVLLTRDRWVHEITTLSTPLGQVTAAVFFAAMALGLLRAIANIVRLHRFVRSSYEWRRIGRVHLCLTDKTHVPFSTRGLWNYYIVLPSALLEQSKDMRVALAHEFQHVRQGDLTWEVLLEGLRPLFVLNPLFSLWKRQVERLRELACDQHVLARRRISAVDYCGCLLRVCANSLTKGRVQIAMPSVALLSIGSRDAERFLKLRVQRMLARDPQRANPWLIGAFLLPMTCAIALSALVLQRSSDWSQDRLMLSTIVNLERLNQRNGNRQ